MAEYVDRFALRDALYDADAITMRGVKIINQFPTAVNAETVRWIPVTERLPENSKKEGAFCPRYFVMTKYGESFGWYNPNFKSWFVLFWFFTDRLLEKEIDFERADVPKIVKVPDGVVTHWMPLPQPPKGE